MSLINQCIALKNRNNQKFGNRQNVSFPLDSASTITNPAGIAQVEKRVDFGITCFSPDVSYSTNSAFSQVTNNGKSISSDSPASIMPAFGLIFYKEDNITLGVGAYGASGMGVDYESNLYNNVTSSKYTFMKFVPAVAYSVNDKLSFGFAPNLDYATMYFETGSPAEVAGECQISICKELHRRG